MTLRLASSLRVRSRLLMAFMAIASLVLLSAAAGIYALSQVGASFNTITEKRVPQALSLLELSRQSESVVRSAPNLLAVTNEEARSRVWAEIEMQVRALKRDLEGADGFVQTGLLQSGTPLPELVSRISNNLSGLNALIQQRNATGEHKAALLRSLTQINTNALRLIMPAERVLKAQMAEWRRMQMSSATDQTINEQVSVATSIIELVPQQLAGGLIEQIHTSLAQIAEARSDTEVDVLLFPLKRALEAVTMIADSVPQTVRDRLKRQLASFETLAEGPDSIAQARRDELKIIARAEDLLAVNALVSALLTETVSRLVATATAEIAEARSNAADLQLVTGNVLVALALLGFAGSILIVWLYVDRSLVSRLTGLSRSMLAIAGGDLNTPLPSPGVDDEIGRMAKALAVFRDTAIIVKESNLREIESARRRLMDAIENSAEAFAFYGADDRLVVCNSRYRELIGEASSGAIEPGTSFDDIANIAASSGLDIVAAGREAAWATEFIDAHRHPGGANLFQSRKGRWVMLNERLTDDGGTVSIFTDVTDLKQREEELSRKSTALERVSNQLSKYLSPQVYDSIFYQRQDVKIASKRKRLTVFFSDLVGFTETTERLESEDLTRLLNQYLTEMSAIAIAHGATIDKYMGDAILIFFGDPETRGVKEDALACVKMAIAMRKRMIELQDFWRASGLEFPLRCRTGINTGICTVGNFGSENRMEYTILGGGVNLAARLETRLRAKRDPDFLRNLCTR